MIQRLIDQGAEAIILGCTEIMLLVSAQDSSFSLLIRFEFMHYLL